MIKTTPTDKTTNLKQLANNCPAVVVSLEMEPKIAKHLADLGITPNTNIEVVRKTIFSGTIEVKLRGNNLVIGGKIASGIRVREL
jgi:Fe2+ transport system protein A